MYSITGYAATTYLKGSTEAITRLQENNVHGFQRPDADYVDVDVDTTTLRGHAGSISFGKIAGESTRFSSYVGYKSPGFDTNDLGFMRRADERNQSNWFQWRNFKPGKYVRTRNFNINQYQGWNFGGDRLYSGANINSHWTFDELLQHRRRLSTSTPRRSAIASRAAVRACSATPPMQHVVLRQHRQSQGVVGRSTTAVTGPTPRTARATTSGPYINWRADLVDVAESRDSATTSTTTTRSG